VAATGDTFFVDFPSIKDRPGFEQLDDSNLMLEECMVRYAVNRDVTLQVWDADKSQPLLLPHADNVRHQQQVVVEYMNNVLRQGVCQSVRGAAIAVSGVGGSPPHRMITWGTLIRAIFLARDKEPDNKKIQHFFDTGIEHCVLLHEKTPRDVIEWLRDFFNSWHKARDLPMYTPTKICDFIP